jgi:hypothetical protein
MWRGRRARGTKRREAREGESDQNDKHNNRNSNMTRRRLLYIHTSIHTRKKVASPGRTRGLYDDDDGQRWTAPRASGGKEARRGKGKRKREGEKRRGEGGRIDGRDARTWRFRDAA